MTKYYITHINGDWLMYEYIAAVFVWLFVGVVVIVRCARQWWRR